MMQESEFPRISVIVPAYNVEHYIEQAIDSLLNQSKPFFEIIIVNDGSTDSTKERLRKYEANALVKVIHSDNQGLGAARNNGVARAHGDFIYFFDSDDLLSPMFVETISKELNKGSKLDLIFFSGETFFDFRSEFRPEYNRKVVGYFSSGLEAFSALLEADSFEPHACMYVSRRCKWGPGKLQFLPIVHEDEALILSVCAAASGTLVLADKLYRRRIRENSIMTSPLGKRSLDGIFIGFMSTVEACLSNRDLMSTYSIQARRRLNILLEIYLDKCVKLRVYPKVFRVMYAYARLCWMPPIKVIVRRVSPIRGRFQ